MSPIQTVFSDLFLPWACPLEKCKNTHTHFKAQSWKNLQDPRNIHAPNSRWTFWEFCRRNLLKCPGPSPLPKCNKAYFEAKSWKTFQTQGKSMYPIQTTIFVFWGKICLSTLGLPPPKTQQKHILNQSWKNLQKPREIHVSNSDLTFMIFRRKFT